MKRRKMPKKKGDNYSRASPPHQSCSAEVGGCVPEVHSRKNCDTQLRGGSSSMMMMMMVMMMMMMMTIARNCYTLLFPLRGAILNRTYGTHENLPWSMFRYFYLLYLVLFTTVPRNSGRLMRYRLPSGKKRSSVEFRTEGWS